MRKYLKCGSLLFMLIIVLFSCNANNDSAFKKEQEELKTSYKIAAEKLVKEKQGKITDAEMLIQLDSLTEQYIIVKNKQLAIKFAKTKSGLNRVYFLREHFSKTEIKELLDETPAHLKSLECYTLLKEYIKGL